MTDSRTLTAEIVELEAQPTAAVRLQQPMAELDLGAAFARSIPPVARAVHLGTYDGLAATYDELHDWIHAQPGYDDGTGPRESYVDMPSDMADPSKARTEEIWPLVRE